MFYTRTIVIILMALSVYYTLVFLTSHQNANSWRFLSVPSKDQERHRTPRAEKGLSFHLNHQRTTRVSSTQTPTASLCIYQFDKLSGACGWRWIQQAVKINCCGAKMSYWFGLQLSSCINYNEDLLRRSIIYYTAKHHPGVRPSEDDT